MTTKNGSEESYNLNALSMTLCEQMILPLPKVKKKTGTQQ